MKKENEEEFQPDAEGGSFSFNLGSNGREISLEDWLSVSILTRRFWEIKRREK